jgi:hypothetical protein
MRALVVCGSKQRKLLVRVGEMLGALIRDREMVGGMGIEGAASRPCLFSHCALFGQREKLPSECGRQL